MWLDLISSQWMLLLLELWIHLFVVAVVGTLLDYVVSFCRGAALAKDWTSRLHLPVDQLHLFFDFFKHLLESFLLEDALCPQQVFFGFLGLGRVVDHVQRANHFVGLRDVH